MRVLVGISGGVDSTWALYSLSKRFQVKAVFFRTGFNSELEEKVEFICSRLGIDWTAMDLSSEFRRIVVERFVEGYSRGLTPNPCIWCNPEFKFGYLLRLADEWGFDKVATGHYARVIEKEGRRFLAKARDERKDQSYFLYRVIPMLDRILFPLGEVRKEDVKREMKALFGEGFFQKESQDLCFVHQRDYRRFLEGKVKSRSGLIVDVHGEVLGQHNGVHNFTVGQRRGLPICQRREERWYVVRIDEKKGTVIVARELEASAVECRCDQAIVSWREDRVEATAKIRYNQKNTSVVVVREGQSAFRVIFGKPQRGVAPGQHVVLYRGNLVIGGGQIVKVTYPWERKDGPTDGNS